MTPAELDEAEALASKASLEQRIANLIIRSDYHDDAIKMLCDRVARLEDECKRLDAAHVDLKLWLNEQRNPLPMADDLVERRTVEAIAHHVETLCRSHGVDRIVEDIREGRWRHGQ